ncbi:MAG TPA: MFS transporter [Tepidisphaeraceae bacterium]|jgi:MFS family permease|nr:MFS transporter [Tepidisphaeraceae bacterium]
MTNQTQPTLDYADNSFHISSSAKWLVLLAAFLGWMFDGLEMGIFPQISRPALTQLLTQSGDLPHMAWWNQFIAAMFLWGAAVGGLLFGYLGDRIGRVKAMSISIVIYSIFTGLLYFVQSPSQLATLRFVAAIGMGGEWALGVALVMEVWDAKHRPVLAGLIGAASNVGFVLISAVGAKIRIDQSNWRLIVLAGAAPALLTFIIQLFVPESHKWKESQKIARSRPMLELFGNPRLAVITLLAISFASVSLLGTWGAVQNIAPWAGGMKSHTATAIGFSGMMIGLGAIIGCMVAPFIAAIFNRRIAYFLLCLGSLISCQVLFRYFTDYTTGFLIMAFIVGGITAAFYGWLPLYLPELFPTRVRATAQGVAFNFGRIAAGFGAITGARFGKDFGEMGSYVSLIYIAGMILIWLAPETKGKPLPD